MTPYALRITPYALSFILLFLALCLLPLAASANYETRYATVDTGAITFTGNTLGLSKASGQNNPGTNGSIGAFICLNPANKVGSYPSTTTAGTTLDWTLNGSAATLTIPASSTILYAELIWSGSYQTTLASGYNTVTLTTPLGSNQISTVETLNTVNTGTSSAPAYYYVCHANVTSIVQGVGAGTYTYSCGHVFGTCPASEDNANAAGWTLAVAYRNTSLPERSLTIFVGCELTDTSVENGSSVTGFCSPASGTISGRLAVSAIEGDCDITGDYLTFGPSSSNVTKVSGSNNPINDFFCSQMNNDAGTLDKTGSYGASNQTPLTNPPANISGGRQGWDITNVDISGILTNGETSAYMAAGTTQDRFTMVAAGMQINVGQPIFPTSVMTVDKATVVPGQTLTYTVTLDNTAGSADALNVYYTDNLPPGTSFVTGSFTQGGAPKQSANPFTGVVLGTVAKGTKLVITYQVYVNYIPPPPATASYTNNGQWTYQFASCPSLPLNNGTTVTASVVDTVPRVEVNKVSSPSGTVTPGNTILYTITVTNDGTANATAATFQDAIPTGTTYVANSTTLNGTAVADVGGTMPYVTASAINAPGRTSGVIDVGDTATIVFKVLVVAGGPPAITNTAAADADGTGPAPPVYGAVTNPSVNADLGVTITDGVTTIAAGSTDTYTVTVTNYGPSPVSSFTLYLPPPTGIPSLTYTPLTGSYNSSTLQWTGFTIAQGQSIVMTVSGTINGSATGSLATTVTVIAPTGTLDTNSANNTATDTDTFTSLADVGIAITDNTDYVFPSATSVYVATVTNYGPTTVSDVTVLDTLPSSLTLVSYTPDQGFYNASTGLWSALTLATGQSVNLTITVTVSSTASGTIVNPVTVATDPSVTDNNQSNNSASDTDTVGIPGNGVLGTVYLDANHDGVLDGTETGTGITGLYVKLVPTSGTSAVATGAVTAVSGAYTISLTGVSAGTYNLVLTNSSALTNITPYLPAGYIGTEAPNQTRSNVTIVAVALPNQNFGLYQGSTVSGTVFADTGVGGGTANDGVQNGAEPALPGVTLKLTNSAGTTIYDTETTTGTGSYTIWIPYADIGAALKVVQTIPDGYIPVSGNAGTTPSGSYSRTADTITFTPVSGATYTGANFGDVPPPLFTTDGSQTTGPGTVLVYSHTFTAGTAGSVSFSVTSAPSPATTGWNVVLYRDANGNGTLDNTDPQITGPYTFTSGGNAITILAQVFVPVGAVIGAQDLVTITATFTYTNVAGLTATLTHKDLTFVATQSGLRLTKSEDRTLATPGQQVTYTITYLNVGAAPITNVVIRDDTPDFTTFSSASYGALPPQITTCTITAPAVGAAGSVLWTMTGPLLPGTAGTVTYAVTITP